LKRTEKDFQTTEIYYRWLQPTDKENHIPRSRASAQQIHWTEVRKLTDDPLIRQLKLTAIESSMKFI
jgi:hypothetical protein